jgi:aminopeptidase N
VVNAGGHGFYRVRYAPEVRERLVARLSELAPLERYGLVADLWAFVLAGDEPAAAYLDFVRTLGTEEEPVIWEAMLGGLDAIDRYAAAGDAVAPLVRDLAGPQAAELGWSARRREGDLERRKRRVLLTALGRLGQDPATRQMAREVFARVGKKPGSIDPDVERAAVIIVAGSGTAEEYEQCLERYRGAGTPQEEMAYLRALPLFPDRSLAEQTLERVLAGEIRSQDAPAIVAGVLGNGVVGDAGWEFVSGRWDEITAALPPITLRRVLEGIPGLATFGLEEEVAEFFAQHPVRGGGRFQAQQLERLRVRAAFRDREAGRVGPAGPGS